jgi:hypothetical protein
VSWAAGGYAPDYFPDYFLQGGEEEEPAAPIGGGGSQALYEAREAERKRRERLIDAAFKRAKRIRRGPRSRRYRTGLDLWTDAPPQVRAVAQQDTVLAMELWKSLGAPVTRSRARTIAEATEDILDSEELMALLVLLLAEST